MRVDAGRRISARWLVTCKLSFNHSFTVAAYTGAGGAERLCSPTAMLSSLEFVLISPGGWIDVIIIHSLTHRGCQCSSGGQKGLCAPG
jgi:hypothetical protein